MNRRGACLFAFALVIGCKSTGDIRSLPALSQGTSARSVDDVAGCFALAFAENRAIEVRSEPIENGISVAQKMRVVGIASTMTVADITRADGRTVVTMRAIGAGKRTGQPFMPALQRCL